MGGGGEKKAEKQVLKKSVRTSLIEVRAFNVVQGNIIQQIAK